jgi:hypothetical protein
VDVSDLSHETLDGSAPAMITCEFENGQRRVCTITAAEAARLEESGVDVTKLRGRVWFGVKRVVRRLLPWAAGILIGSLVLPALTKQWSDRQGMLALKQQITSEISSKSVRGFSAAYRGASEGAKGLSSIYKAEDAWDVDVGSINA